MTQHFLTHFKYDDINKTPELFVSSNLEHRIGGEQRAKKSQSQNEFSFKQTLYDDRTDAERE